MLARSALVLSSVFLAFMLGLVAPAPTSPILPARKAAVSAPSALRPAAAGEAVAAAGLADLDPAPPKRSSTRAPPLAAVPPPAPPAPPPVEAVLRRAVSAVTEDHGRLVLVLAGGGALREGDAFQGWRLASVSRTGTVLVKGASRRAVSFFQAPGLSGEGPTLARPPPPGAAERAPSPPTAAEFFRGFKG